MTALAIAIVVFLLLALPDAGDRRNLNLYELRCTLHGHPMRIVYAGIIRPAFLDGAGAWEVGGLFYSQQRGETCRSVRIEIIRATGATT